jgi:hypothetical protein
MHAVEARILATGIVPMIGRDDALERVPAAAE